MDDYVAGSVADLISYKALGRIPSKKRKIKLDSANVNRVNEKKSITVISNLNSKSENHLGSSDSEKISYNIKESKSSIKKNRNPLVKVKKLKNRKKLSEETSPILTECEETDEKEIEGLLPLNFLPSDSEEEEKEEKSLKKNFKEKSFRDNKENTIFVGNIPISYDKQKVCKVFSKFGEIQNARIRCVPVENINMSKKVAAIKKKFNQKRNSLVAYVKFKSQDSANKALKANGMIIDGHHIRVDLAEQLGERDNNKAVFVGGLPFDIEDDELWEFFQNCGQINSVRVIRDSQTSMGKGFGYVNFDSTASVELALQLDGQELKKRTINVKRCVNVKNKNKLNSFGKKKSKEITNQLLCKKSKKFKEEKKKLKKENKKFSGDFQGKTANVKQKKKKKLSKTALRQRKLVKILGANS